MSVYLIAILSLIAMIWSSFTIFGPKGLLIIILVGILWVFLNKAKTALRGAIYFMVLLFIILLSLPAISAAREAARRMQCCSHMKMIALALLNYSEAHGCFPPACIRDKNDNAAHSWRVLVLPSCEENDLFARYSFDEPWNGPKNQKLLTARPNWWVCPSDGDAWHENTCTSYVAVVGKNAAWSDGKPKELTDAEARTTVILVEVAESKIPWSEPRDLDLDQIAADPAHVEIMPSSNHPSEQFFTYSPRSGANVALADGSVRFIPGGLLAPERLPNLLKVGGFREELLQADWRDRGELIHWPRCIAAGLWPVSVICLLVLAVRSRKRPAAAEDGENA